VFLGFIILLVVLIFLLGLLFDWVNRLLEDAVVEKLTSDINVDLFN